MFPLLQPSSKGCKTLVSVTVENKTSQQRSYKQRLSKSSISITEGDSVSYLNKRHIILFLSHKNVPFPTCVNECRVIFFSPKGFTNQGVDTPFRPIRVLGIPTRSNRGPWTLHYPSTGLVPRVRRTIRHSLFEKSEPEPLEYRSRS